MRQTLWELESCFFKRDYISNRVWLDNILHEAFCECGKSGHLADKQATIEGLLACGTDRDIHMEAFECREISAGSWMVHYITKSDGRSYYRTSIWVMENEPRLLFHQASLLQEG